MKGQYVSKGYIQIPCKEHPSANRDGYVLLHRLVMEEAIGRYLSTNEIVHHINGCKTDNRIENLKLMSKGEHTAIHNASKKGYVFSEESRKKMSIAAMGNTRMLGKKMTEETKRKMSESRKGKSYCYGNKSKLGQKLSEETKLKISISLKERHARKKQITEGIK